MPSPSLRLATPPAKYDPESPMRQPAFWRGALATRDQLSDPSGSRRLANILTAIEADTPLAEIPDYRAWLTYEPPR